MKRTMILCGTLALLGGCSSTHSPERSTQAEKTLPAPPQIRNPWAVHLEGWLEEQDPRQPLPTLRLALESISSLDGRLVFVGGTLADASPLRTILFRSEDGGRSWEQIEPMLGAATISRIEQIDRKNVIAFVQHAVEASIFNGVLRSPDSGHTWSYTEWVRGDDLDNEIREHVGCCFESVLDSRFRTLDDGYVLIGDARYAAIHTQDGGATFELVRKAFTVDNAVKAFFPKRKNASNRFKFIVLPDGRTQFWGQDASNQWGLLSTFADRWSMDWTTLRVSPIEAGTTSTTEPIIVPTE